MCGISGILNFTSHTPEVDEINIMIDHLKHRGPDANGYFIEKNVALGHTRLSILDLSESGNQPFESFNNRFVLVYNGEIYNYVELRKELENEFTFKTDTDTEVLLNAYIKWGEEFLNRLNGMFALAIYDRIESKLFCARDRFGVKPFYYYKDKNRFIFASEPKAIIAILKQKPKADFQRIYDFLVFNRTDHDESTFFEGIKKLTHGHTISIQNKEFNISKWYNLREEAKKVSFTNPTEYYQMLQSSINIRLRSDVPVGLTLSGGLDSSAIASILIHDFHKSDLNTFSAVYGQDKKGDESKYINLYKDELKNMHAISPSSDELLNDLEDFINTQQEPFGTTSIYANYKIMKEANHSVKVMLNGQGADEHLAGYHYFFGNYYMELFKRFKWIKLTRESYMYYKKHHSFFAIKSFIYYLVPSKIQSHYKISQKGFLNKEFVNTYSKKNNVLKKLFDSVSLNESLLNHFDYKLEHLLKWDDRNSMRFGIESRNPFLDYRLIEKSINMPINFKINQGITKKILRDGLKGILPEEIRNRQDKIGFSTPEDEWFRSEKFKVVIFEILQSSSFKKRNIVDPEKAIELYNKHLLNEINISTEIWKWINLELWFRKFID
ncbi:MAG: asparagine synthase (glutamine-hydrolyzing) [Flavobacteriia bacterium]|nr:asparagine synthase (glutamine-hydrolyzing) [Flavobacteriia bacterium]